jgi:hypothetical protein
MLMAILYAKFDLIPITKGYNKKTSIFWMYFFKMGVYSGTIIFEFNGVDQHELSDCAE